ncbi:MAG: lamin tail domain-containing protein [bacterium]|nr:MAG: lamin tail domain-containing protein [bacterium]
MKINFRYFFKITVHALILTLLASRYANSQIILTEIMFDPIGSEYYNEFIEIYNISPTDTIDLSGWQISDSSDVDFIISHEQGTHLKPQQYAIILDPGYFQNSEQYENLIPADALILTIDDGSFGSQGLSNSYPEPIILISSSGDTAAKYQYTLDNQPGYSDEKRNQLGDDSPENWANSKILNGTPGMKNSISPKNHDLSLKIAIRHIYSDSIIVLATISNVGLLPASQFRCDFYVDRNMDSLVQENELVNSFEYEQPPLLVADSIIIHQNIPVFKRGKNQLIAELVYILDEKQSNNRIIIQFVVPFNRGQLIINEIMFRPLSGNPEWIEIFNPGVDLINLNDWKFSDAHFEKKQKIVRQDFWIAPKQYILLAESEDIFALLHDSLYVNVIIPPSWSTLNNNLDQVVFYDLTNKAIDSMRYFSHWSPEAGISLERIDFMISSTDSSNWAASIDPTGSTPGRFNSVSPVNFDLTLTGINFIPPKPFPNEEITISICVTNVGRFTISEFQLTCSIDLNNDNVFQNNEKIEEGFTIHHILERGESVEVSIPYTPSNSGRFSLGATIFSENDLKPLNNFYSTILSIGFYDKSLVINEIMYSPAQEQSEWVELYNPQNISMDIQNWSYSDADSSKKQIFTEKHIAIAPHTFVILAADSSVLDYYDLNNAPIIVISKWPTLNNDQDDIFIFDANDNIIDCLRYNGNWGGDNGISLERINPNLASDDSSNWSSCVHIHGGTPGLKNSIFVEVLPTEAELSISPNPFSPDGDGRDDVTIINYQLPFNLSQIHVKIFDIRGRQVRFLINNRPSGTNGSIIWDGRDDQGHLCRMGIYIVYLEAIHYQRGVVKSLKKSVVLANQL